MNVRNPTVSGDAARFRGIVVLTLMSIIGGVVGCAGDRSVLGSDGPPPAPDSPFGTLVVHAGVASADEQLAGGLDWEQGIPDAVVHLQRIGTGDWETRMTDDRGEVTFGELLPGDYRVYVERQLRQEEAASAGLVVRAFGDGETIRIAEKGAVVRHDFELGADRSESLVISEVSNYAPPPWVTNGSYYDASFVEVYNNGSVTVFLDQLVLGVSNYMGGTVLGNCATSAAIRGDPLGIYSAQMIQFPGVGNDYPIRPGESRVVALSAIDHRPIHPSLFDLSGAAFEIVGPVAADNPAVPNMTEVGLTPLVVQGPAGSLVYLPRKRAIFLARPIDPGSLPILYRDNNGRGYVRIPADHLIDVASLTTVYPDSEREHPPCHPWVAPVFDRYEGGFLSIALGVSEPRVSFQRRVLRVDGHPILQDTNTSAADFVLEAPSPGTLPNQ